MRWTRSRCFAIRRAAARGQTVAAEEWRPSEALQQAISDASELRAARTAFATYRRRRGVTSAEEALLDTLRQVFVRAILAIPEQEAATGDEQTRIAVTAPPIVRPVLRRGPRVRPASLRLHEALLGAEERATAIGGLLRGQGWR